jgi:hypothetical protein
MAYHLYYYYYYYYYSRISVVGIATHYGLDGPGIESVWWRLFRTPPDRPGAHPASSTMDTGSLSWGKAVWEWR